MMGLFSKKTLVCQRCGKEFQSRLGFADLCAECVLEEEKKRQEIRGYELYAKKIHRDSYPAEKLDEIAEHRWEILEKYRTEGISLVTLCAIADQYKQLTDDEAQNVLLRIAECGLDDTLGAAVRSGRFFVLTDFEKAVVDMEDVFAVGITGDYKYQDSKEEAVLCAVFTNDPYIPVFPMVYIAKKGFFDIWKSKKGREAVKTKFELMCPNLTYKVQELKQLKKEIKEDGKVRGNLERDFMLDMISDASLSSGIFKIENMKGDLGPETAEMMETYGYLEYERIVKALKMDQMFHRTFWKKQMERLDQRILEKMTS